MRASMKPFLTCLFAFSLFAMALLPGSAPLADASWVKFVSQTAIYKVRIPREHTVRRDTFSTGQKRTVYSEELSAIYDQRPYKNTIKSYVVKIDQTIGPAFSNDELAKMVKSDIQYYTDFYRSLNGTVKDLQKEETSSLKGALLYIEYNDPEFGPQGFRIRIRYSDFTKLQQMVTGPIDTMFAYKTRDFFDSLKMEPGLYNIVDKKLDLTWQPLTMPKDIFTLYLPPKANFFYTQDPVTKSDQKSDSVLIAFEDPVRNQKLLFNNTAYRFDADLTYADVFDVLVANHISKNKKSAAGVEIKKGTYDGIPVMETEYTVNPPRQYPFMKHIRLRALFRGNYVLVQEMMGSRILTDSDFASTLLMITNFHPEKAITKLEHPEIFGPFQPGKEPTKEKQEATPPEAAPAPEANALPLLEDTEPAPQ